MVDSVERLEREARRVAEVLSIDDQKKRSGSAGLSGDERKALERHGSMVLRKLKNVLSEKDGVTLVPERADVRRLKASASTSSVKHESEIRAIETSDEVKIIDEDFKVDVERKVEQDDSGDGVGFGSLRAPVRVPPDEELKVTLVRSDRLSYLEDFRADEALWLAVTTGFGGILLGTVGQEIGDLNKVPSGWWGFVAITLLMTVVCFLQFKKFRRRAREEKERL